MIKIIVRNLSENAHRVLKARATRHGHSVEAEIREILEAAVRPAKRLKIGSELAAFGRRFGDVDLACVKDNTPIEPASFD